MLTFVNLCMKVVDLNPSVAALFTALVFSVSVCLCGFSSVPLDEFPVFEQM